MEFSPEDALAHGAGLFGAGLPGGGGGGGDHGQYSRHGGLGRARPIRRVDPAALRCGAGIPVRPGRHQRALPQRFGLGGGQFPGRRPRTARVRSNAPSTASASGPATPRWRRSSWRSRRAAIFSADLNAELNTREIVKSSRLVSRMSGLVVQRSKAIVGENAFAHSSRHSSGRHFEEARNLRNHGPARRSAGAARELPLTKHSGRAAVSVALEAPGLQDERGGRGGHFRPLQGNWRQEEIRL